MNKNTDKSGQGQGHTPGPWRVEVTNPSCGTIEVWSERENIPVAVTAYYPEGANSSRHLNARLIAAAPEMLEACKRALPWIGKMIADGAHLNSVAPSDCESAMNMLQASISKATGQS